MRILTHRSLAELARTAEVCQCLQSPHGMHRITSPPLGRGHAAVVNAAVFERIPEMSPAWTLQTGPAVTSLAKTLRGLARFPLGRQVSPPASQLLVKGLGLALALGRDADIAGGVQRIPPPGVESTAVLRREGTRGAHSSAAGGGRPEPIAGLRPLPPGPDAGCATGVSWLPAPWSESWCRESGMAGGARR
jgi:hypothetical protein